MGEKYSAEDLARLKSVATNMGGRTKENHAGVPIEGTREVRSEEDGGRLIRETVDHNKAVVTEHQDGRQDVNLHPKPAVAKISMQGQEE